MIAIYTRKSIYSDKSDSVKNQEQMCLDFIRIRKPNEPTTTYTDEGFTGANTDRPNLNRLIQDIRAGKIDTLVVYQLDRLSRSVRDFAVIFDLLEEHKVAFLSVKESIDTSSPIGKAMMYITTVFAQMERETISQRVADNLQGLAKQGFWTGGNPPIGYIREKVIVDGKKHTTIIPSESAEDVKRIYRDFLQNEYSLTGMQTVYKNQRIKTQNGAFFSSSQLYKILTCPFYVPATPEVYDFYSDKGCKMIDSRDTWTGETAVMIYGRTTERNKKHQLCSPSEWMVCKGKHEPIIDVETWLNAQKQLQKNVFIRQGKYPPPLLKGVLRCKECGCLMQVSRKHYGEKMVSYYYCVKRSRQGSCTMSQIRTDKLDDLVLDVLKKIDLDPNCITKYIQKPSAEKPDIKKIEKQIRQKEKQANNLVNALSNATDSARIRLISALNDLDKEIIELNRKRENCLDSLRNILDSEDEKQQKVAEIQSMVRNLDKLPPERLNQLCKNIIQECTFDGQELFLRL